MKRKAFLKAFLLYIIAILMLTSCAPKTEGSLEILSSWARTGIQGGNSAIYFTVQNNSGANDFLVSAACDAAKAVELHISKMDDSGTMMMQPVKEVELPAGQSVEFKPGGLHVMLIELQNELKEGDEISVTLNFKNSTPVTLKVPIKRS